VDAAALLSAAVLIGLRDVVAAAPRHRQLQLHHLLCNPPHAGSAEGAESRLQSVQQLLQHQDAGVLPWLQLLLVTLECASGPRSLKLLASHAGNYSTLLLARVAAAAAGPLQRLPQLQQQQLAAAAWSVRCFESMLGREATFDELPSMTTAAVMSGAAGVLQLLLSSTAGAGGCPSDAAAAVYCSVCSLLVTTARHRSTQLSRLMHFMNAAARNLLLLLLEWDRGLRQQLPSSCTCSGSVAAAAAQQAAAVLLVRCGGQLGRLYEALAEQGQLLGRSCHYAITDYVMHMAAAVPVSLQQRQRGGAGRGVGGGSGGGTGHADAAAANSCSQEVAGAVRRGACLLFGVLRPAEVQAVHAVCSQGALGGVRRDALAALKAEYEDQHRHSGRV
jgi:hypothetical protein